MNRNALRYALRQFIGYFVLAVAAVYTVAAVLVEEDRAQAIIYAALFAVLAGAFFVFRYRHFVGLEKHRAERAAQEAEYVARMDALVERGKAQLAEIEQERDARRAARGY